MINTVNLPPFKKMCITIGNLPSSFMESMTYYEALCWLYKYFEETLLPAINTNSEAITELQNAFTTLKTYVDTYFDNLDVQEEINNKLDDMAESGELADIIINYLKENPITNDFDLQRIGRKITYGTNPNSSTYVSAGIANGMQGGCYIGDNKVAYMLWDNLNQNLNKNKLVIMNILTGEIIDDADFTFGWCNSLAYNDGKIYVCVRGTTDDGVATNNGLIKVINATSLLVEDEINLSINANAISIYDDKLYVLQENTNSVHIYELNGNSTETIISLAYNISDIYNQDIKVTDKYIYLISTRPSNLLNVFNLDGTLFKSYNVKKYGGIYKIGELQWIDVLNDNDMLLGSCITEFEETLNQFFKFNLVNNISTNNFNEDYADTLYCDSNANNYNPDGTINNKFSSIQEASNLNISIKLIDGGNKNYKYTSATNQFNYKVRNATFTEGLFLQYGHYTIVSSTIDYSINSADSSALRVRDSELFLDTVTLDANNNAYCILSERYNQIKFISPTFSNFTTEVFSDSASSSIIHTNSTANIPYIPRLYGRDYNLMSNGLINQYKEGTYSYNTSLTASQIEDLFNKATRIEVCYIGLNKSCIQYVIFDKASGGGYTISDTSIAGSNFNFRCSKAILTIDKDGVKINSNKCSQILYSNSTPTFNHLSSEDSGSTADNFIQIRAVKLILD